jgi:hypothetical protein
MREFVDFLRERPKGLLLAKFALTAKAGRVRGASLAPGAFGAPDITEA